MNEQTMSFDRMRGMLVRAAELRDSEQQQIFDSLDEIHARLAGLDALGTVRKRLTELPDRTEVGVLAERLDEAIAKLDAQDTTLAAITRALEALPDKLAKPIAALDGRLDGMAGRLEGVSGRMDGLDDRLGGLHKRLDELDSRLDRHEIRLDAMPTAVGTPIKEKIDGIERMVREQIAAALKSFDETGDGLRNLLGDTGVSLHRRLEDLAARPAVDPTSMLDGLATRLDVLVGRLDALESELSDRPDTDSLTSLVSTANEESERRSAGQLDEAMATFAELIMGRGPAMPLTAPPPRATTRRAPHSKVPARTNNGMPDDNSIDDA